VTYSKHARLQDDLHGGVKACSGLPSHGARVAKQEVGEITHLAAKDVEDGLCVDEARVAKVVQAATSKDLAAGFEPDGLTKGSATVFGHQLRRYAAERAEHRPASVDDLKLTVPAERLRIC
jgi:hypothetical protein